VGVAKTRFHSASAIEVYRGLSKTPLFVTAVGMEVAEAAAKVATMAGSHRNPQLLKGVDHLARECFVPLFPMQGCSHDHLHPRPHPQHCMYDRGESPYCHGGWVLLPPGDAALTRRVKAAGDHWVVAEKKGRKVFAAKWLIIWPLSFIEPI